MAKTVTDEDIHQLKVDHVLLLSLPICSYIIIIYEDSIDYICIVADESYNIVHTCT